MACFGEEQEEEKLFEMVCDFIESESESSSNSKPSSSSSSWVSHRANYFALQEILGKRTKVEIEVLERVLKHMKKKMDGDVKKWLVMKLNMDGYNASLCHTSWSTSLGCPAGDYEYIEVVTNFGSSSKRLIVDIDFKSQFELARPTKAYKELIEKLIPTIFVGNEDKLSKVVSILCSAAKQSLRENGLHIPPWRTTSYMNSKWLSINSNIAYGNKGQIGNFTNGETKITKWAPPIVDNGNLKRRYIGGSSSALSSQFSNMRINCC